MSDKTKHVLEQAGDSLSGIRKLLDPSLRRLQAEMEKTTDPVVRASVVIKIERLNKAKEALQGAARSAYAASADDRREK